MHHPPELRQLLLVVVKVGLWAPRPERNAALLRQLLLLAQRRQRSSLMARCSRKISLTLFPKLSASKLWASCFMSESTSQCFFLFVLPFRSPSFPQLAP